MSNLSYFSVTTLSGGDPVPVTLITGAVNGTVIRSLEISNTSGVEATVYINRFDDEVSPNEYGAITLILDNNDYVILWSDSMICLPEGHTLVVSSNQEDVSFVANCTGI